MEQTKTKKPKPQRGPHGGARKGAGRHPITEDGRTVWVTLRQDQVDSLNNYIANNPADHNGRKYTKSEILIALLDDWLEKKDGGKWKKPTNE